MLCSGVIIITTALSVVASDWTASDGRGDDPPPSYSLFRPDVTIMLSGRKTPSYFTPVSRLQMEISHHH